MGEPVNVNVDNFVAAETARKFGDIQRVTGGINTLSHMRNPTPLDRQTVIRMNRDTLYSFAIVDISKGAIFSIPDAGDRYVSVMVINEDHYVNRIFHDAGEHTLTQDEFDSPYVLMSARILVDPTNAKDIAEVNALQDALTLSVASHQTFVPVEYDETSLTFTRKALLELAKGMNGFEGAFGARGNVDPVRHVICSAAGWGGMPEHEAFYINVDPELPVGEYELTVRDVPLGAFWSISLYNADGFFEENDQGAYNINSVTAARNDDGSITAHFGGDGENRPNCLPIMEGWNYLIRLYQPQKEILNGSWVFPSIAAK